MEYVWRTATEALLSLPRGPEFVQLKRSMRHALSSDQAGRVGEALPLYEEAHACLFKVVTERQSHFMLDSASKDGVTDSLKTLLDIVSARLDHLKGSKEEPDAPVKPGGEEPQINPLERTDSAPVGFLTLLRPKDVETFVDSQQIREADDFNPKDLPLHDAIRRGLPQEVAAALGQNGVLAGQGKKAKKPDRAFVNGRTPKKRRTPLHLAAICLQNADTEQIINMLVRFKKVDLNAVDYKGYTALHLAIIEGLFKNALAILRAARSVQQMPQGVTETLEAAEASKKQGKKRMYIKSKLKQHKEQKKRMPLDFTKGASDTGATALALACSVPVENDNDMTAFTELLDVLIHSDLATVNQPNARGETPLHLAVFNQNCLTVSLLLSYSANVNAVTKSNATALHYAVLAGHTVIAEMLLRQDADKTIVSDSYGTPFDLAEQFELTALLTILSRQDRPASRLDAKQVLPSGILDGTARRDSAAPLAANVLDLSGQGLSHLVLDRYMQDLSRVDVLDLRFNNLEVVPPVLGSLAHLEVLLEGNPLTMMPESCRSLPWAKMRAYLASVSVRRHTWSTLKLCVMGAAESGKTALVSALTKANGVARMQDSYQPTNGVNVVHGVELVGKPTQQLASQFSRLARSPSNALDSSMKFTVCDLGGRSVFYPLHHFFLSYHGVYIVTLDLRELIDEEQVDLTGAKTSDRVTKCFGTVDYWLRQIRFLGSIGPKVGPSIVIVGTHADLLSKEALEVAEARLMARFPRQRCSYIADILLVSSATGKGTGRFKRRLMEISGEQRARMEQPASPRWILMQDFVMEKRLVQPSSTWKQFRNWASRMGMGESEVLPAMKFLSNAGTCIHFDEDPVSDINNEDGSGNLLILNPQWLADTISTVMTVSSDVASGQPGRLHKRDMAQILGNFTPESWDTVTKLLEDCELIHKVAEDEWLLPSQLPDRMPVGFASVWPALLPEGMIEHGRKFEFEFFPVQLFSKLLVRLVHRGMDLVHAHCWKKGIVVRLDEQIGLVTYSESSSCLDIAVRLPADAAASRKNAHASLLRKIVETFATLMECSYQGQPSNVRQLCPCIHCIQQRVVGQRPFYFTLEECLDAISSGQLVLYCRHIQSLSRSVRVDHLAPDLSLYDLPRIKPDLLEDTGVVLGEGGFGIVRKCRYDGAFVAVKELTKRMGPTEFMEFQREAYIASGLFHPNILLMHGVTRAPMRIVQELAPIGDLYHYMHGDPRPDMSWPLRMRIALDIAKGLQYLHGLTPPVVHRDFRSPNIFLFHVDPESSEPLAKVADFGLSREAAGGMSGAIMTWRWAAPEAITGVKFDERCDIYSLAIIMWEIASLAKPFEEFTDKSGLLLRQQVVEKGLRPTLPEDCPEELAGLIKSCWASSPAARPEMEHVVRVLSQLCGEDAEEAEPVGASVLNLAPLEATMTVSTVPRLPADHLVLTEKLELPAKSLVVEPHGDDVLVGCADGKILQVSRSGDKWAMASTQLCPEGRVQAICSLDESRLVSSSTDGVMVMWRKEDGRLTMEQSWTPFNQGHATSICVVVQIDGRQVLWVGSPWGEIRVYCLHSLKLLHSIDAGLQFAIHDIVQLHDTVWVAAGSCILVYSVGSLALLYSWKAAAAVKKLLSCGRLLFAACGSDILSWKLVEEKSVRFQAALGAHSGTIKDLVVAGGFLFSCSFDKSIIVWDTERLQPVQELTGYTDDSMSSMAVTEDNGWLISTSRMSFFVWKCFDIPPAQPDVGFEKTVPLPTEPEPEEQPRSRKSRRLKASKGEKKKSSNLKRRSSVPDSYSSSIASEAPAPSPAPVTKDPEVAIRIVSRKNGKAVGNCMVSSVSTVLDLFESIVPSSVAILKPGRNFVLSWAPQPDCFSEFFEPDLGKSCLPFLLSTSTVYLQGITADAASGCGLFATMSTTEAAVVTVNCLDEDDI